MSYLKRLSIWFWLSLLTFCISVVITEHGNTIQDEIIAGQFWVVSMVCMGVATILRAIELGIDELKTHLSKNKED